MESEDDLFAKLLREDPVKEEVETKPVGEKVISTVVKNPQKVRYDKEAEFEASWEIGPQSKPCNKTVSGPFIKKEAQKKSDLGDGEAKKVKIVIRSKADQASKEIKKEIKKESKHGDFEDAWD